LLDEATSALDPASQDHQMELLTKELSATTIVSVAHRPELEVFHHRKSHAQASTRRVEVRNDTRLHLISSTISALTEGPR
jgi:ABC-type uncharacterized transport system fused permease/ATPase subunit